MKKLSTFASTIVLIVVVGSTVIASIKTSRATGNWNTARTWTGNTIPATGDTVVILNRHNITVSATPTGIPGAVKVNAGGTLTINNGITLTIVGSGTSTPVTSGNFGGAGTLATGRGTVKINLTGNWSFTGTVTGTGLVVTFNGTDNQTVRGNATMSLIVDKPSGEVKLLNAKTIRTLTITSGTFNPNTYLATITTFQFYGGMLIVNRSTWGGNYSRTPWPDNGTTVQYTNASPTINAKFTYQNLIFSGTGTTATPNDNLTIQGNLLNTGGGTLNFGTRSITFSGTVAAQSIAGFTTTGTVRCTKTTGTATLMGNVSSGRLLKSGNGTLNLGAGLIHNTTDLIVSAGILDGGSNTLNISGTVTTGGIFNAGTGTVNYNASGDQTIASWIYNNLILSGSGVKTTTGVTVNGILSLEGTATASVAPMYGALAVLQYKGSAEQTTGPELPATMTAGATIDNTNGVVLSAPTTIDGTLNFMAGNMSLGVNSLTLGGSVTGATAGRCVVINSTGGVVRSIGPSASGLFPVGPDAAHYNPVTLTGDASHTADNFTVTVASGAVSPAVPDNNQAVQATWNISEAVAGGSSVIVDLGWSSTQHGTTFSTAIASIWQYNASTIVWQDLLGGVVEGTDPYTLSTSDPVTSFSPFCVGNAGALPVEMTSFTAVSTGLTTRLRWTTATEVNSYNFEIERRPINTSIYSRIGTVQAAGISNATRSYEFNDANVAPGRYIYRLKMNDNDGTYSYFGNAEVKVGVTPKELTLKSNYPNPFNPSTFIEFTLPEDGHVTLKVYNVIGQQVATLFDGVAKADQYKVTFNASQLSSGIYFSILEFGNQRLVRKMMLTK